MTMFTTTIQHLTSEETLAALSMLRQGTFPVADIVECEVTITPKLAQEFLRLSHNRRLRKDHSWRISRDMKSGAFDPRVFASIDVDDTGHTINGQHRLQGVVTSEATITFRVRFNVPRVVQRKIDMGVAPRTIANSYEVDGLAMSNAMVATANSMAAGWVGWIGGRRHLMMSVSETRDFITKHYAALLFTHEEAFKQLTPRVTSAPVRAVVARAYYTEDHAGLRAFGHVMCSGLSSDGRKSAITAITFREMMLRLGQTTHRAVVYRKASRALRGFLDDEVLGRIYEAPVELFPLDSEPVSDGESLLDDCVVDHDRNG